MTGAKRAGLLIRAAVSGAADLDEAIRSAAGAAPIIRLNPDFEGVAGITSHDDKVLHAWKRFATGEVGAVPPALASVVHAAAALSGGPDESSRHPAVALPSGSGDF